MKISVVIPAYNEEKWLPKCLESLASQEIKPDEIIVVDNNSTDKTAQIASKFKARLVKESKQGLIYARNRGFDSANCEIIARTDADSVLPTNWIKQIKSDFENSEIIGVSGPIYFYDLAHIFQIINWHVIIFFKLSKLFLGHEVLHGPNFAIRKAIWKKVRKSVCRKDKNVHEDMDLAIHMQKYGQIKFDPNLRANVSIRRMKNVFSFFGEYPIRFANTIASHKLFAKKEKDNAKNTSNQ